MIRPLVAMILMALPSASEVLRVNQTAADSSGDGSSWAMAYRHLQDALAAAQEGDELWIAEGCYYPDEGVGQTTDDPNATFQITEGISLYGGFNGSESQRFQRDTALHPVILSGDIEQNDLNLDDNCIAESPEDVQGTNTAHLMAVATAGSPVTLDGLIFTGGWTDQLSGPPAGLSVTETPLSVRACIFSGNFAYRGGGGAYLWNCSPLEMSACTFRGNGSESGGALLIIQSASALLSDCSFLDNTSRSRGGALYLQDVDPDVTDCSFTGNDAESGAAVYCFRANASISRCEFLQNSGGSGAALWLEESDLIMMNTVLSGNTVSEKGGAIFVREEATLAITNCILSGNVAEDGGGLAVDRGSSRVTMVHCTVSGNSASSTGGAVFLDFAGELSLRNSIVWNNLAAGERLAPGSSITTRTPSARSFVGHSCVENSGGSGLRWDPRNASDEGGNLDLDPRFMVAVDPSSAPTIIGDLRPKAGELRDIGDPESVPVDILDLDGDGDRLEPLPFDSAGLPRVDGMAPDLGAYERKGPVIVNPIAPLRLLPNFAPTMVSVDLTEVFSEDAISYEISVIEPPDLFSASLDSVGAPLVLTSSPDAIGTAFVILSATDAEGNTTDHALRVDVFPEILFVDVAATGAATGLSWQDAFQDLQRALHLALPGTSIWVASGAYRPNQSPFFAIDDPAATFQLPFGVKILGGFDGSETMEVQRDPSANLTVLSGDLAGDDVDPDDDGVIASVGDIVGINARGVVRAEIVDDTTCLDGFCVTGGSWQYGRGGGLFSELATPQIRSCRFIGNSGSPGGAAAVFGEGSGPCFVFCDFSGNESNSNGGALYLNEGTICSLVNCRFVGNTALSGGAIYSDRGKAQIFGSLFAGNAASSNGAALYLRLVTTEIVNCTFTGNRADGLGGALFDNQSPDGAIITNCIIWNNMADGEKGMPSAATSSVNGAPVQFRNCLVENSRGSGPFWVEQLGVDLGRNLDLDPLFSAPIDPLDAPVSGGEFIPGRAELLNQSDTAALPADFCDLDGDGDLAERPPLDLAGSPRNIGSGIDLGAIESSAPGLTILPPSPVRLAPNFDSPHGVFDLGASFDDNAVSFAVTTNPPGLIEAFVDTNNNLVLNALPNKMGGVVITVRASDLSGIESLLELRIEVRAEVLYVDKDAAGDVTGLAWDDAFPTLQEALAVAGAGTEVWIASGVYYPDEDAGGVDSNDQDATFQVPDGSSLFGGFTGGEMAREERDPSLNPTVLSGDIAMDDMNADGNAIAETHTDILGANSFTVVTVPDGDYPPLLSGLIITAGSAEGDVGSSAGPSGGGLFASSNLVLEEVRFAGNRADERGGAVAVDPLGISVELTLRDCLAEGNLAKTGGAIAGGMVMLIDCRFERNEAVFQGGAVDITSLVEIRRCQFQANQAGDGGGGAIQIGKLNTALISNCLFAGNTTTGFGGAVLNQGGNPTTDFLNCTFSGNSTQGSGGAVANGSRGKASFRNCLIWNNEEGGNTSALGASVSGRRNNVAFANCLIANSGGSGAGWAAAGSWDDLGGNLDADPVFEVPVDLAAVPTIAGNLRLQLASPVIDAGDNAAAFALPFDLDQAPRMVGYVDIGCYEVPASAFDQDLDGLPDTYELANTNPVSATLLDPASDDDQDGLPIWQEFAFGYSPTVPNPFPGLDSGLTTVGEESFLKLSYPRNPAAAGYVDWIVETSLDLGAVHPWERDQTLRIALVPSEGSGIEQATEQLVESIRNKEANFARLSIEAIR